MKGSCLPFFLSPMQCLPSGSLFISLFAAAFNFFLSQGPSVIPFKTTSKTGICSHVAAGLHQDSRIKMQVEDQKPELHMEMENKNN